MGINIPDNVRKYTDLQCNDEMSDYTECPDVQNALSEIEKINPKACLELGCGLGRVSVWLQKRFAWDSFYYLLDGDTGDKQVAGIHHELGSDYYNSKEATVEFCVANSLGLFTFLNAQKFDQPSQPIDFCYSFKAIGFHWPVTEYLKTVHPWLSDGALLVFGVRSELPIYSNTKIWQRRVDFNRLQLMQIEAENKYDVINKKYDIEYPVLILQKRKA